MTLRTTATSSRAGRLTVQHLCCRYRTARLATACSQRTAYAALERLHHCSQPAADAFRIPFPAYYVLECGTTTIVVSAAPSRVPRALSRVTYCLASQRPRATSHTFTAASHSPDQHAPLRAMPAFFLLTRVACLPVRSINARDCTTRYEH